MTISYKVGQDRIRIIERYDERWAWAKGLSGRIVGTIWFRTVHVDNERGNAMNLSQNTLVVRLATLLTCAGLCTGLMAIASGCEEQNAGIAESGGNGGSEESGGKGKTGEAKSAVAPPTEEEIRKRYETLIEEYHPKFLTDEPNAWPQLAAILQEFDAKYPLASNQDGLSLPIDFSYLSTGSEEITKSQFESALAKLESARADGFFARTGALVGNRRFVRPVPPRPIAGDAFVEIAQARNLSRAQVARMAVALSKNDYDEAAKAFEEVLLLGKALAHQATTDARLASTAMVLSAMRYIRDEVNRRELPSTFLQRMKLATIDWQGSYPPLQLMIRGEELRILDTAAYLTGPQGNGGKPTPAHKVALDKHYMLKSIPSFPSYQETAAITNEYFTKLNDHMAKPRSEQLKVQDLWKVIKPKSEKALVVMAFAPQATVVELERAVELETAGLLVMFAIEEYRAKMGKLPTTLSELVPVYLSSTPPDPFGLRETDESDGGAVSSDGGVNELVYKVTNGADSGAPNPTESTSPRGYILYSVGADGIDDGGKADPAPSRSIKETNLGFDMVLTQTPKYRPAILRREELKDDAESSQNN